MDIRARLLLAFSPLLILLIGTAVALPLIQRGSEAQMAAQVIAADALSDVQSLELSIMHEHDAVVHLAEGETADNRLRLEEARTRAEALIAHGAETSFGGLPQELELRSLYLALTRRHDIVLETLARGDQVAAEDQIHEPSTEALLDRILTLSGEAKAISRARLDAASLTLQQNLQQALVRAALSTVVGVAATLFLAWLLVGQVVGPLDRLTADAERAVAGGEVAQLSHGGNTPQVRRLRDAFQNLLDANRAREDRVEAARAELERRVAYEERLRATVEALSLPVMPLGPGTLLLPLVGHLDERRAGQVTDGLLEAIGAHRARAVVIDLTGLAELSGDTARLLRETADAARLLGCRVTLVGVRAEQAMALVGGEFAGGAIATARDIPSVLAGAKG